VHGVLAGHAQRLEIDEPAGEAPRHFDVQLIPDTGEDGQVRGFFYTALDVTERSRAEQALRSLTHAAQRQTEVLRLVTEAIPATVVVVGADGRYRFANSAFSAYCGLSPEHIIGRTTVEVLGPEEVARRRPFMQRAFAGESVTFALDYPGDDGPVWLALHCIPLRNTAGEMDGFVGVSQDITRERREQDRLTALSQRDPLTGLLNRAGFEHFLGSLGGERQGASLGLLYLDLDHFKPVNDQHGHPVGDRLLQLAAERMSAIVRPSDAVARLGGDEFAILLVEAGSLAHAETVAQKVVHALAEPFVVDGLTLHIGASVGVGFGLPTRGDWQALIQRADQLLYQAKRAGRGRMASG
jgi:diguanylate cyclase (GGDEF)-like protein/PAS domain S-box-containing protein